MTASEPKAGQQAFSSNLVAAELFEGGGQMGELMRSIDWSKSPVGPVQTWPQSLRTA